MRTSRAGDDDDDDDDDDVDDDDNDDNDENVFVATEKARLIKDNYSN